MGILGEIGSLATTTATGGWSIIEKYMAELAVVLVLVISAGLWGYHLGSLGEKNAVLAAANKTAQKTVVVTQKQTVIDTNVVGALSDQLARANGRNEQLQRDISKLKSKDLTVVRGDGCNLSKSFIDNYNESIQP